MELNEFISETILQIASGIKNAQDKTKDLDVIVNPNKTIGQNGEFWVPRLKNIDSYNIERRVQSIEMDISLTVTEKDTESIGGGIGISVLGIKADSTGTKESSTQNRVKFTIPICLPTQSYK